MNIPEKPLNEVTSFCEEVNDIVIRYNEVIKFCDKFCDKV